MPEVVVGDTPVPLLAGAAREAAYVDVLLSLSGGDLLVRTDGPLPNPSSGVRLYNGGTYTYPLVYALRGFMVAGTAGTPVTVLVEGR